MSKADKIFKQNCREILETGYRNNGFNVRTVWPDTHEPAYTIAVNSQISKYDLSEEFPAITIRRTAIKTATDEMLWIWKDKSNNVNDFNGSIWDEWADNDGSIGRAYGYQQAKQYMYKGIEQKLIEKAFPNASMHTDNNGNIEYIDNNHVVAYFDKNRCGNDVWFMTQLDKAIYDLVNNPFSRRIIVTMWNPHDLKDMNLEPCAYQMTFMCRPGNNNKIILDAMLTQRSQDMLAASNWNVCQYAVLVHMIARHTGMEVGTLTHVVSNAHIYDRHEPIIRELIEREEHEAPKFWLNPEKTDFYEFTRDDVKLIDYVTGEQIKNIPIAI